MVESDDFFLVTLSKEDIKRVRNIRKRRLISTKIKELKDKILRYKNRKKDITILQEKKVYMFDIERQENMIEEVKLIDVYILDYEKLIRRLQREYCNIKV